MKCPVCGEEIGEGKHKCLRCGYEVHELSTSVREPEEEVTPTVDIDPRHVHISGGSKQSSGGGFFDDIFGGGLFGGLLDGLFGGFFDGFDDADDYDDGVIYDDFGSPIRSDVDKHGLVELKAHEVEYIEDDSDGSKKEHKTHNGVQGEHENAAHNGDTPRSGDKRTHKEKKRFKHRDKRR